MPKIRKKNSLEGGRSDKSGSVTKAVRNIIREKDNKSGFYPSYKSIDNTGSQKYTESFNDNNTINFTEKDVNHSFGIESSYGQIIDLINTPNDLIHTPSDLIHTPSEFDLTNSSLIVSKQTIPAFYDRALSKATFEKEYKAFNENSKEFSSNFSLTPDIIAESIKNDYRLVENRYNYKDIRKGYKYKILSVGKSDFTLLGATENEVNEEFVALKYGKEISFQSDGIVELLDTIDHSSLQKIEIDLKFDLPCNLTYSLGICSAYKMEENIVYKIVNLGSSEEANWTARGASSSPNVGDIFKCVASNTDFSSTTTAKVEVLTTSFRKMDTNTSADGKDYYINKAAPIAYYNKKDERWDYLGKTQHAHYSDTNQNYINTSAIGFSPLENPLIDSSKVTDNKGGDPIVNFGFPYSTKFQGKEDHLINLESYIDKDFVVKKIRFEGDFSNKSESNEFISANLINFFVLNQRNSINVSELVNSSSEIQSSDSFRLYTSINYTASPPVFPTFDNYLQLTNTEFSTNDDVYSLTYYSNNQQDTFKVDINSGTLISDISTNLANIQVEDLYNPSQSTDVSQREIIGFNQLVNISIPKDYKEAYDYEFKTTVSTEISSLYFNLKEKADLFIDSYPEQITYSSSSLPNDTLSISSYDRKSLVIDSYPKLTSTGHNFSNFATSFYDNDTIESYEAYEKGRFRYIYTKNNHGTRTLLNNRSGRSISGEEYSSLSLNKNIHAYSNVNINSEDRSNICRINNYVLKPKDTLIIGAAISSFFHSAGASEDGIYSGKSEYSTPKQKYQDKNFFFINKLKLILYGSYQRSNDDVIDYDYSNATSANIKRTIIGDTHVTDRYLNTPIQLGKNNFYARKYTDSGIDNQPSDISDRTNGSFSRATLVNFIEDDSVIYDTAMPSVLDILTMNDISYKDSNFVNNPIDVATLTFWKNENPFLEAPKNYLNLDRYSSIRYSSMINYSSIISKTNTEVIVSLNLFASIKELNTDLNKYFYTFNCSNKESRIASSKLDTIGNTSFDGYRLGVLSHERRGRKIYFNTYHYGYFSDKVNYNKNHSIILEDKKKDKTRVFSAITKKFINTTDYEVIENPIEESVVLNTYNRDFYARINSPYAQG